MLERITRPLLFGAYQLSILIGIVFLPIAVLVRRLGVTLPVHRVIRAVGSAYESYADES